MGKRQLCNKSSRANVQGTKRDGGPVGTKLQNYKIENMSQLSLMDCETKVHLQKEGVVSEETERS